jgi:endonuclease/exonuclease/phosphatase family metal-dependent hydrolase
MIKIQLFLMRLVIFLVIFVSLNTFALADSLRIATWNMGVAWDSPVEERAAKITAAGAVINADIYVLQEITSFNTVKQIARLLGRADASIAVSDFSGPSDNVYFDLEVAVVSAIPIKSVTEYQFAFQSNDVGPLVTSGVVTNRDTLRVPDVVLGELSKPTQKNLKRQSRGVLRVELTNGLIIYAVHAKSEFSGFCSKLSDVGKLLKDIKKSVSDSRHVSDIQKKILESARDSMTELQELEGKHHISGNWAANAEKREALLGAAASLIAHDATDSAKTIMILGDFNIPLKDDPRVGSNLKEDCNPTRSCTEKIEDSSCSGRDGLDDSHAILSAGIVDGLQMRSLTDNLTETLQGTFSSAIDHIYVVGANALKFGKASTQTDTEGNAFGSDHLPVFVDQME